MHSDPSFYTSHTSHEATSHTPRLFKRLDKEALESLAAMASQQNTAAVSSSNDGTIEAWLYNNYVFDRNAAAAASKDSQAPFSRAQSHRRHPEPLLAHLQSVAVPIQLRERSLASESETQSRVLLPDNYDNEFRDEDLDETLAHATCAIRAVRRRLFLD